MKIVRWIAALAVALPTAAWSAEPEAVFKLVPYRKTVAIHATVAGHEGLFVFDTGSGVTLISPQFASKAGLAAWGRDTGFRMMGERSDVPRIDNLDVVIDGKKFTARAGRVFDVMSAFPKDATPIDGIIALDAFDHRPITIDFPHGTLTVETPDSLKERVAGATELPVLFAREMQGLTLSASVGVPTPKGLVWMELDSGNGGTVLVNQPYAELFGLDPKAPGPQKVHFDLAKGLSVDTDRAFTPDMILEGNLGMPFLQNVVVTLDMSAGRLWIKR